MKKLGLLVMPIMAVSFLASCGSKTPQIKEHYVSFESYGGSHIPTQRVKDGEKADSKDTTPSRGHDTFTGWYKDPLFSADKEFTFDEAITKDITLYAKYDEHAPGTKYTVTFHADGADEGTVPASQEVDEGDSVKETSEPTKGELHFVGWYTDIEAEEYKYDMNRPVFTNLDLYARFVSKVHTVKWYNYDMSPIKSENVEETKTPTCDDPSRPGEPACDYDFIGWFPEIKPVYSDQEYIARYERRAERYNPDVFISFSETNKIILEYTKTGDVTINWGDGVVEKNTTTHTYTEISYHSVRINGNIASIKGGELSNKYMERIYLGSTITAIPNFAFSLCNSLKYIYISPSVKSIGESVFDCSTPSKFIVDLTGFTLGDDVPTLTSDEFSKPAATIYVISDDVRKMFIQAGGYWKFCDYVIGFPPYSL